MERQVLRWLHALVHPGFWDPGVFTQAAGAVAAGGLLGWEALTLAARTTRPRLPPDWCLGDGEPASLLPAGFTVLDQHERPDRDRRQLLARRNRAPASGPQKQREQQEQ